MLYEEFVYRNDRNKRLNPRLVGHIESTDFRNRRCVLKYNGVVCNRSIDDLVQAVMTGNISVSNSSKLTYFKFDKKEKATMFYEKIDKFFLCHGSSHKVEKPKFGFGACNNDYGQGFYCVLDKNKELAKEWSCSFYEKGKMAGVVNTYEFATTGMNILNLDKFDIIYWVVLTAYYRQINGIPDEYKVLFDKYLLDISKYDCIYGWRCDDSFANIIKLFFSEHLTAEAVYDATRLGHLQQQFVLKSKRAFEAIKFLNAESVPFANYAMRFDTRKRDADRGVKICERKYRRTGRYINDYLEGDL